MEFKARGRAWKFGDHVNVEYISPTKYLHNREDGARHCMEPLDPDFSKKVSAGDLIVAGEGFGCGPGHDHANLAIKDCGVAGVIAKSFGTQFFRHSIDHALLIAECGDILDAVNEGDELEADFGTGQIVNLTTGAQLHGKVPQGPAMKILRAGGLIPFLREQLGSASSSNA